MQRQRASRWIAEGPRWWASAACLVVVLVLAGAPAAPETPGADPPGAWRKIPGRAPAAGDGPGISEADLEALEAIGYLGAYTDVPDQVGVTHHDPERAQDGYNLYVSGHAPEAVLADMEGRVIHRWSHDATERYGVKPSRNYWRRVHLAENGDLYAVCDPHGILKLDQDSRLLWASDGSERTHHDLSVTGEGVVYALGKDIGIRPEFHDRITLIDDTVVTIAPSGRTLSRFPMLAAFGRGPYGAAMHARVRRFLASQSGSHAESFHTNTIEVLDGSLAGVSPLLKKGNIVFCSPTQSTVWIIDGETETVVWSWTHDWGRIHQPTFLPDGNWLLFHNSGYQNADGEWRSRVVEYDFPGCNEVWSYGGIKGLPETEFYSGTSSLADRLPNGNTLITVSESGRAIEVTPDKEVVWEFSNPKRAGENNELIATLFQVERIPRSYCKSWLTGP
ncbi:MAG: hypothetical protein KF886_17055 [Candidatus Hydrogenedentes bacterium]|nr:hypothetical protein [Candidatus Hydrogenedentota bacterium]